MTSFFNFHTICIGILFTLVVHNRQTAAFGKNEKAPLLNIAIIGSGVSGLATAKNALAQGYRVTIFEQSEDLGGIWRYTDKVGKDKYGVNIHTAMYQGLRTNSPYQTMEFPDHPFPNDTMSYPPHTEVLKYLHSYANRFGLKKNMKLNNLVVRVLPIENGKWELMVRDLPNDTINIMHFDVVFVCNGNFASPRYPDLPGIDEYKGKLVHSHDFRTPKTFRGENVLVIGGGPSGIDLVIQLSKSVKSVTFSQRGHFDPNEFPSKTVFQGEVVRFTSTGVEFMDGTNQSFSVVFLATGYNYRYPFLSVDTDINVNDNCVSSLYKQVFNIEHPTMAFIGVPVAGCTARLQDLQARFALKFISGGKKLPSKKEMLEDTHAQMEYHYQRSSKKHNTHVLGDEQKDYYKQLAETAGIENIPDVLVDIHRDSAYGLSHITSQFRKYKYTIKDNKTFTKKKYEN